MGVHAGLRFRAFREKERIYAAVLYKGAEEKRGDAPENGMGKPEENGCVESGKGSLDGVELGIGQNGRRQGVDIAIGHEPGREVLSLFQEKGENAETDKEVECDMERINDAAEANRDKPGEGG